MTVHHRAKLDALGDFTGPAVDMRIGGKLAERVGQKRELDVLEHGLPMQRARVLKHDPHTRAGNPVRRPAGHFGAIDLHRAGIRALDAHDQFHHGRLA